MQEDLLDSLRSVRWDTAFRVFGNNHATLIGLLVDWWISGSPSTRWALEGGPAFGYLLKGIGGGICDAILGEHGSSKGVLEVEGTRYEETLLKIGKFFSSTLTDLRELDFAIFLAYAYSPQGVGLDRRIPPVDLDRFVEVGLEVSSQHPGKRLIVLALDKTFERQRTGPRARNEYYMGRPTNVRGSLLQDGQVIASNVTVALPNDTLPIQARLT